MCFGGVGVFWEGLRFFIFGFCFDYCGGLKFVVWGFWFGFWVGGFAGVCFVGFVGRFAVFGWIRVVLDVRGV